MDKVVIDAFAILALLEKEKGYETVKDHLERSSRGKIEAYMSLINWGEVYYTLIKKGKTVDAEELWEARGDYPIAFIEPTVRRIRIASKIKGSYPVSFADAFCISLAIEIDAKVITGDSEFREVNGLELIWI